VAAPATGEAPVLIAGGGLVGLSAAAFLASHGIRSLTIERLPASSPLPRAAFFHMRTLEMFRELGVEDTVRTQSAQEFVPEGAIIAMDALAGRKLADIIPNLNEGVDALSPCRRLFLNQPTLEPILRRRAREAGATIVEGAEIVAVQQDATGVTLTMRMTADGSTHDVRGAYLIAADGAHSTVRASLGIEYEGRGAFSNSLTIYFTADLSPYIGDNAWSLIYVNNPSLHGFFRLNRAATAGFLGVNVVGNPALDPDAAVNAAADLSESRLRELVRAGVGKDIAVRIDGYSRWRATASTAKRLRLGRVFIAGDAAHLMPPNGGFGGNTGIHDAHNLAWKLAHVIKGHAGPGLLDSYERERKPVGTFTVEQAFSRYVARTAPWLAARVRPDALVDDLDIELGYLYDSPLGVHADPRGTRGIPGSRAPHLWLERRGQRLSTIDLAGRYVLLTGSDGAPWAEAAGEVGRASIGLPLDVYCVGSDLTDPKNQFPAAFGISPSGACLVRPDGFVAWNCPQRVAQPAKVLRQALATSLCQS
jgi:2-polyprenyl-6-methoxyphenol hydroxylase-like FAD-dependent oxidoreductase